MSEFQYYEFQAIDRPLTEEEQEAVAGLSGRVHPHPWRAVFVYHWSDFPGRAEEVLAKYYDAMLYMANWGSRQLMFRFPEPLIDLDQVVPYFFPQVVEDYVSFSSVGEHMLLNIDFYDEEAAGWIEEEGWLPSLVQLREDILRGDYRVLYLAWLKVLDVEREGILDSVLEPPVPPGLKNLSPALRSFAEFFEIDQDLIRVAAQRSTQPLPRLSVDDLQHAIAQLPLDEKDTFLLRLAQDETHLSLALNRRLGGVGTALQPDAQERRTVGQLLDAAEEERERVEK